MSDASQLSLEVLAKEAERAKEKAHITQVFLDNITYSLPQYVFWKDINSVYLGCNKNFAELIGLDSPENIVGKTDHDIQWQTPGDSVETFQQGDQYTLLGNPITNQEEILVLPSGKSLITLVSKLPIMDNGKAVGIVGYFTDITEMKQKEKELIKAKELAESAYQAKQQFILNIRHDIRTPFVGISSVADILLMKETDPGKRKFLEMLHVSANALLSYFNEILEVTHIENGSIPLVSKLTNVKKAAKTCLDMNLTAINTKDLEYSFAYDDKLPEELYTDEFRFQRVLINLIGNAVKFTSNGRIDVNIYLAGEKPGSREILVAIVVKDTGPGIPVDKQHIIFEKFERLTPSYQGVYKGSGLGLFSVRILMNELGGDIDLKSKEGEGSTFTCMIPMLKPKLSEFVSPK